MHACTRARAHAHLCTCAYTPMHLHPHTCVHTHMCTPVSMHTPVPPTTPCPPPRRHYPPKAAVPLFPELQGRQEQSLNENLGRQTWPMDTARQSFVQAHLQKRGNRSRPANSKRCGSTRGLAGCGGKLAAAVIVIGAAVTQPSPPNVQPRASVTPP